MSTRNFLIIGVCALVSALALNLGMRKAFEAGDIRGHTISPAPKIPALARSLRPNYPYSVIPGGAYSPAELKVVNERDSLIRDHYAGFNVGAAQLVMLTADRYQYVSFRLKNRIFWTRNKLRIPKGEILLTDGHNYARTRCGNRLSSAPQPNTTPLQPPARLLSLPPYTPQLVSQLPFAEAPPIAELTPEIPTLPFETPLLPAIPPTESWPPLQMYPPIIPIVGGYIPTTPNTPQLPSTPGSPVIPPTTPVTSQVPEPASFYLFLVALCISAWILTRMMRRNPKIKTRPSHRENSL